MKFRVIIVLSVFLSLSAHAQRKKPEDSPHDKAITKMYSYHRVNMDSMQYLARDILSKSDKDDDYALTCANHGLGVALYHQHFYDSALYYFLEAMQFAKKKSFSNSEYGHMDLLYNCGVELKRTGSFELSEQFLEDALSIAVSMGDTVRMIKFNHGLSITYEELADYPKAIAFVSEAIRLSKLSGKDYPIAYVSLGNYCRKNKDFAKATDVLTTLIQDSAALNTKSGMHTSYYLSKTYSDQGDVKRAEEVLRRAILTDPGKSKNGYFYCLYELGVLLKQQGNTDEAIEYLTRSEAYVDDNPDNEREFFEVFQVLSNLHNLTNKELADTYHQKYLDALDKYTNNHRRYNLGKVVEDYYANIEQEAREASVRTYSVVISSSLLVLLGLTFSVSQYQRHRTKKKLEKESIDKRMAELKALKAQINPHFLFNALNSIQSYILSDEKNVAEGYLVKYGKLMRKILDHSNELTVPLQEELEALHLYVELEQLRVKQGFEYEVKLSDDLDPYLVQVPSMVIQPFIENAIWHGVSPLDHPGKITLSFEEEGDFIVVRVQDNGVGFDSEEENANHTSKGVGLVRERLELLKASAGEESVLSIHSEPGKGTEVVLRFSGELV